MNAITMLKDDHKTVNGLFRRFERAGPKAHNAKRDVVDRIIEELSVHAAIEELVFYPAVRAEVPRAEDMTLEALEEHHIVKWTLSELQTMDPHDERFEAKVTVLIESVRHHVEEEESDLFPKVRAALSTGRLEQLGEQLAEAKKAAPTKPHPRLPDTPPLNALSAAAAVVDRVTGAVIDTGKSALDVATPGSSNGGRSGGRSTGGTSSAPRGGMGRSRSKPGGGSRSTGRTAPAKAAKQVSGTAKKATTSAKKATRTTTKTTGTAKKAGRAAKKATRTAKKATSSS
jgi:hemerythrin superfamily protein